MFVFFNNRIVKSSKQIFHKAIHLYVINSQILGSQILGLISSKRPNLEWSI